MPTTLFGIRHHGPGCARSLVRALDSLRPDLVLIEGPEDADELIATVGDEHLRPPVAILVYDTESPKRASFYPFAEFSPEWQALLWARKNNVPVRFLDLPCQHRFALDAAKEAEFKAKLEAEAKAGETPETVSVTKETETPAEASSVAGETPEADETPRSSRHDPLSWLARADGYSDGERWWNDRVEERGDDAGLFAAIAEALTALREELALPESKEDLLREAWMRRGLREAARDGAQNIAMVCGAWHVPALAKNVKVSDDSALLRGLPKAKVRATWAPWTFERLTSASGYGAGVESPGWYEHLWRGGDHLTERWITRAARLLRDADLSAPSASVIEAVRLSTALAGLRGRPKPGLPETMEAMRTVFCTGDATPLSLLRKPLLVGERLGELPEGLARLPLQEDIERQQKSLRLKPLASVTPLELDLREAGSQARSAFLHRLLALGIRWGTKTDAVRGKGTFKEQWSLKWEAEMVLAIIDASSFGNTLVSAAESKLAHLAGKAQGLDELVRLLEQCLLAELPAASEVILARVQAAAASGDDPPGLLRAIPPLARLARYGNVRQTDLSHVEFLVVGLATRAHVEVPSALSGLDEEAAAEMAKLLGDHDAALRLLENETLAEGWREVTRRVMDNPTAHPLLRGLCARLQRDAGLLDADATARHLAHALSPGNSPADAVAWLEGFLSGGGALLIHDHALLGLLHAWLGQLPDDLFQNVLPLLRRTFGRFTGPERGQIGQAVRQLEPGSNRAAQTVGLDLDETRAKPAVQTAARLLGLNLSQAS